MLGINSINKDYLFGDKSRNMNYGIYARKSTKDKNDSITHQIETCKGIAKHNKWEITRIYKDENRTGTNLNRDGFKEMLKDVENGTINGIIITDLSRLSRSYADIKELLYNTFLKLNIRVYFVNEHIDSAINMITPDDLMQHMNYIAREPYLASMRTKNRLRAKMALGSFIGSQAPFGYSVEKINIRRKLIINPKEAEVVKSIFSLFLTGKSPREIAKILDEKYILPPSATKDDIIKVWGEGTIKSILRNEVYIGNLVQHKQTSIDFTNHKVAYVNQENHIRVENTHESIITKSIFNQTNDILNRKTKYKKSKTIKTSGNYQGLLYCGDCGSKLTSTTKNGKRYYICSNYKKNSIEKCTRHSIRENILNEMVSFKLITEIGKYNSLYIKKIKIKQVKYLKNEINVINSRIKKIDIKKDKILEYYNGEKLKNELDKVEDEMNSLIERKKKINNEIELIQNKDVEIHLNKMIINMFIKKIEIYENKNIKIYSYINNSKIGQVSC